MPEDGLDFFALCRRGGADGLLQDAFVQHAAAQVRIAERAHAVLPSVDNVGEIQRGGADVDHERAAGEKIGIRLQPARVFSVEERCARFACQRDIGQSRLLAEGAVTCAQAVVPARRTADGRLALVERLQLLRRAELLRNAADKPPHVLQRAVRIAADAAFKADGDILRSLRGKGHGADKRFPLVIGHGRQEAHAARDGQDARLDHRIKRQEGDAALSIAQVKADVRHAPSSLTAARPRSNTVCVPRS